MDDPFETLDDKFRRLIQQNKAVGFGRMMQLISEAWYADMVAHNYPTDGILVSTCLAFLSPESKRKELQQLAGAVQRIQRAMRH